MRSPTSIAAAAGCQRIMAKIVRRPDGRRAWLRSGRTASNPFADADTVRLWMPPLLRLPDAIFENLAGADHEEIDPEARSSMWEDLQRGRRAESTTCKGSSPGIADRHGLERRCRASSLVRRTGVLSVQFVINLFNLIT